MSSESSNSTIITESAATRLTRILKSIVRLTQSFEKQTIAELHIEETEKLAELLIDTLKTYPHQTLAQLSLHRTQVPYFYNFCFNACIFSGISLLRNKMNLTTAQQIIAGILTWAITSKGYVETLGTGARTTNEKHEKIKTQLIRALSQYKRTIWLHLITSASGKSLLTMKIWVQNRDVINPIHDYLKHAMFMASALTRTQHKKATNYAAAFKSLVQATHVFATPQLEPLLNFPGEILPGNGVKISNGQNFMVLAVFGDECYVLPYDAAQKKYLIGIKLITVDQIVRISPATPVANLAILEQWWGRSWKELLLNLEINLESLLMPPSYRVDQPPESLTTVIDHLNEQDLDIPKLTHLIESEPGFAAHVKETASHKSRAKMKISGVKHGLLMNGIERTKSVLVEKALVTRLSQHQFPLQNVIHQFVKLWASYAESIAKRHPTMLPEQCSCWVHFAASGLFTNAEIKSQFAWSTSAATTGNGNEFGINIGSPEQLWQHAQKIASSWSQEKSLTIALNDALVKRNLPARVKRSKTHVLISLSLLLATKYYLGNSTKHKNDDYLQQYLAILGLNAQSLADIQQETTENSHTFWPIHNQLISVNS